VIFTSADISEIDDEDIRVIGKTLYEGIDYFNPDDETKTLIKKFWNDLSAGVGYEQEEDFNLIHKIFSIEGGGWGEKKIDNDLLIPAGALVNVFGYDHGSTCDRASFIENYLDDILETKKIELLDELKSEYGL